MSPVPSHARSSCRYRSTREAPRRETPEPEAYDACMMGLSYLNQYNPGSMRKAAECFERAIAKDPKYARAHAKLSMAWILLWVWGWSPRSGLMAKAEESARAALGMDEGNADAHGALADVYWFYHRDFLAAEREFEHAAALAPNDSMRHRSLFLFLGSMREDHERAIAEAQRALELDPLSSLLRAEAGWPFYWARQLDRAMAQARGALDLDPGSSTAYWVLGLSQIAASAFESAIGTFREANQRFGDNYSLGALGLAYGTAGRTGDARRILEELERRSVREWVSEVYFAWVHLGLGEIDKALDRMERACDEGNPHVLFFRVAPAWDPLRSEARYWQLLERLNLLPPIRRSALA